MWLFSIRLGHPQIIRILTYIDQISILKSEKKKEKKIDTVFDKPL